MYDDSLSDLSQSYAVSVQYNGQVTGRQATAQLPRGVCTSMFNIMASAPPAQPFTYNDFAEMGFCRGNKHEIGNRLAVITRAMTDATGREVIRRERVSHEAARYAWLVDPNVVMYAGKLVREHARIPPAASEELRSMYRTIRHSITDPQDLPNTNNRSNSGLRETSIALAHVQLLPASAFNGYTDGNDNTKTTEVRIGLAGNSVIIGRYEIPLSKEEIVVFNALMTIGRERGINTINMRRVHRKWGVPDSELEPDSRDKPYSAPKGLIKKLNAATIVFPFIEVIYDRTAKKPRYRYMVKRPVTFVDTELVGDERQITSAKGGVTVHTQSPISKGESELKLYHPPHSMVRETDSDQSAAEVLVERYADPGKTVAATFNRLYTGITLSDYGVVTLAKAIEAGIFARMKRARVLHEGDGTNDENRQFVKDLEEIVVIGKNAHNVLFHCNVALVSWWIVKLRRPDMYMNDEVRSAGYEGLSHAIEMFDYTRKIKFSTYASRWIRFKVSCALRENSDSRKFKPIYDDTQGIGQYYDHDPTKESDMKDVLYRAVRQLTEDEQHAVAVVYGVGSCERIRGAKDSPITNDLHNIAAAALIKLAAAQSADELREYL